MAMNPLPPQAYTKDSLLNAYAWLQNQSHSIKEMATTPDIMVSLYLKATRDGESALDRPSIQNFKNELKSLAGLMGELEKENTPIPTPPTPLKFQNPPSIEERPSERPTPKPEHADLNLSQSSFDPLTLQMLMETKEGFNLSDSSEALRLLVKLGYLKAKKILSE